MLLSQHGACRPEAVPPPSLFILFLHLLSLFTSVSSCLSRSTLFYRLYFLSAELQSALHSFIPVSFLFLLSSALLTDSSWPLQQQRKFSHMFLIKASHRSPVGRFSCNITAPSVAFSLQWNRVMVRLTDMDLSLTHYPVLTRWDFITLHMQCPSIPSHFSLLKGLDIVLKVIL